MFKVKQKTNPEKNEQKTNTAFGEKKDVRFFSCFEKDFVDISSSSSSSAAEILSKQILSVRSDQNQTKIFFARKKDLESHFWLSESESETKPNAAHV